MSVSDGALLRSAQIKFIVMKKQNIKDIILIVAVLLAAAVVFGMFAYAFSDKSSDVPDGPGIIDPDGPDDPGVIVPDDPGVIDPNFTVSCTGYGTFSQQEPGYIALPADGDILFDTTGADDIRVNIVFNYTADTSGEDHFYYVDGVKKAPYSDDFSDLFVHYMGNAPLFYISCTSWFLDYESLLKVKWDTNDITFDDGFVIHEYPLKIIVTQLNEPEGGGEPEDGARITIYLKPAA